MDEGENAFGLRRLVVEPSVFAGVGTWALEPSHAHYVRDVLRLRVGAELEVVDGEGRTGRAIIASIDRHGMRLEVSEVTRAPAPRGPRLRLIQGLGKGDKMDQVVRQATELGVWRISPVITERAVARGARAERWRTIADDAVRVSGRAFRPTIDPVVALGAVLAGSERRAAVSLCLAGNAPLGLRAFFGRGRRPTEARAAAGAAVGTGGGAGVGAGVGVGVGVGAGIEVGGSEEDLQTIEVLVGPEGGLSLGELRAAEVAGFTAVHLGPNILRTETAGPAAVAMIMLLAGGLDG